jgi:hypothetical protein
LGHQRPRAGAARSGAIHPGQRRLDVYLRDPHRGTLDCWDKGAFSDAPAPPPEGVFSEISVGEDEACGLRYLGSVTCWANFGDATVTHGGPFTAVDVIDGWACAHRPNGELSCFPPTGSFTPDVFIVPPAGTFPQVAIGRIGACGRRADGSVRCWGGDYRGQVTPATGPFTALMAANYYTCGLRTDSTLACWGSEDGEAPVPLAGTFIRAAGAGTIDNFPNVCGVRTDHTLLCRGTSPPAGTYSDVAMADQDACAIALGSGAVSCWARGSANPAPAPPAGAFTQISAGSSGPWARYCGLRSDETIACWGNPSSAADPPAGAFTSVSAGSTTSCGVRTVATIACWEPALYVGLGTPPSGTFSDVAVGVQHACGLRTDGTVTCWGGGSFGETAAPTGSFVEIVAGDHHTCGRRSDGTVACWGDAEVLP